MTGPTMGGSDRDELLPTTASDVASEQESEEPIDAELAPDQQRFLAVVLSKVDQHFHQARTLPELTELRTIKDSDPELYGFMLRRWEKQHDADLRAQDAPWKQASAGRRYALVALLAVLGFAAYLAYLGHPGWATGALVGDLVLLVATFMGATSSGDDK